jgi:hypothetical protein
MSAPLNSAARASSDTHTRHGANSDLILETDQTSFLSFVNRPASAGFSFFFFFFGLVSIFSPFCLSTVFERSVK